MSELKAEADYRQLFVQQLTMESQIQTQMLAQQKAGSNEAAVIQTKIDLLTARIADQTAEYTVAQSHYQEEFTIRQEQLAEEKFWQQMDTDQKELNLMYDAINALYNKRETIQNNRYMVEDDAAKLEKVMKELDSTNDEINLLEGKAKQFQDKLDDKRIAHDRAQEQKWFNQTVEDGKREYDDMAKLVEDSKARITQLEEEAKKLTDKKAISANKRDQKMTQNDLDFAKTRMTELKAEYDRLLEEKKAREETQAFQDKIDTKYDEADELNRALNTKYQQMEKLWMQWEMMETDEERERQQKKIDFL
jgi:hypothetical protein